MAAGAADAQNPRYLTLEQVAEELHVTPQTLRLRVDDPDVGLRGYQLGDRVIRILRVDLEAWIEQEAAKKTGERRDRLR